MSTPFYDLASLVLVPSGYKAQKVYAQKPLTTDGQLTFSRASTATRVNASGLIETVSSNVPRLDYLGSTCPKLQLEPSRTNLALNSETITAGTGATVSLNSATSPDGSVSADKLVEDTSTGFHRTSFTTSLGGSVDSSAYCISIFAKAAGRTRFAFWDNSQDASGYSYFDLSNGTVISGTGKIENYGNGWYRCTIFPLKNFSVNSSAFINLVSTGTTETYTGNGTSGVLFWGKQLEAAAYPTSYVKTEAAAVTRLADACSKTGISSLFGSAFTIFADVTKLEDAGPTRYLVAKGAGSTYQNFISFEKQSNGVLMVVTDGSATTVVSIASGTYAVGQRMKIAARCQNGSYALYINGVQIGVASTAFTPSISSLDLHYFDYYGNNATNQVLVFPSALTNAQLAELTTL